MDSRLRLVAQAMARAAAAAAVYWPDSRDGLRSPEHELAARGVRRAHDPTHDLALVHELKATRARRALPVPSAPPVATGVRRLLTAAP